MGGAQCEYLGHEVYASPIQNAAASFAFIPYEIASGECTGVFLTPFGRTIATPLRGTSRVGRFLPKQFCRPESSAVSRCHYRREHHVFPR